MRRFFIDKKGYPRWRNSNVLVHRTVAAKKVGGSIFSNCVVHHKDGNKRNFHSNNLVVMSRSRHAGLHSRARSFLSRFFK